MIINDATITINLKNAPNESVEIIPSESSFPKAKLFIENCSTIKYDAAAKNIIEAIGSKNFFFGKIKSIKTIKTSPIEIDISGFIKPILEIIELIRDSTLIPIIN